MSRVSVNSSQGQLVISDKLTKAIIGMCDELTGPYGAYFHNSLGKLCHPRSDAYSAEQVLLNKQQIWCGGAYLDSYPKILLLLCKSLYE